MGMDGKDFARFSKAAQQQILRKLTEQKQQNGVLTAKSSRSETKRGGEYNLTPKADNRVYPAKNGRESKYYAKPTARTMPNGTVRVFASKREAERYDELKMLLSAGKIRNLKIQPQFTLIEGYVNSDGEPVRAERYVADFSYYTDDGFVVEDVKGAKTEVYKLKRKQMMDKYGITVKEV